MHKCVMQKCVLHRLGGKRRSNPLNLHLRSCQCVFMSNENELARRMAREK